MPLHCNLQCTFAKLRPQDLNFVDPVHHLFALPLSDRKELTCMEIQGSFFHISILQKLLSSVHLLRFLGLIAVLGSPLMCVSKNLYQMASWQECSIYIPSERQNILLISFIQPIRL